jgi:hypothetical protein
VGRTGSQCDPEQPNSASNRSLDGQLQKRHCFYASKTEGKKDMSIRRLAGGMAMLAALALASAACASAPIDDVPPCMLAHAPASAQTAATLSWLAASARLQGDSGAACAPTRPRSAYGRHQSWRSDTPFWDLARMDGKTMTAEKTTGARSNEA